MDLIPMRCCGIKEVNGISHVRGQTAAMRQICSKLSMTTRNGTPNCSHLIFSEADGRLYVAYGDKLAAFITRNNLGHVVGSEEARNPNSGHMLKVWVWTLDKVALKAWWTAHKPKPKRRVTRGGVLFEE